MITPRFSCTQTSSTVVTSIYCPSIRASEVEVHVDGTLLSVHVAPYFLRLNFPGNVFEDDVSSATYNPGAGYLTITLSKETPGEDFPDLDLLAKLLAPRPHTDSASRGPLIEMLSSEGPSHQSGDSLISLTEDLSIGGTQLTQEQRDIIEAAQNDWQLPQNVPEVVPELHTNLEKPYGFLDAYTGYFRHIANTENEVNELGPDAENLSLDNRRQRRLERESAKWDEEHYIADYVDHDMIEELQLWKHPHLSCPETTPFNEEENLAMLRLPRREYLASPQQIQSIYLTLITILFAYAYDSRFTQHDPTPESAWTICALIPAFSALDPPPYPPSSGTNVLLSFQASDHEVEPQSIITTLVASYRRSLAYPLYRSWALSETCRSDVAHFLVRGKRLVLRCLLEMRAILDVHEVYYVYSRIWLDDLCSWIQSYASEEALKNLGEAVRIVRMDKSAIGWDLEELETAAEAAGSRSSDSDDESEDEVECMAPAAL